VCARWRGSFEAFLADVGPKPSPAHSLDRIDVNGHYEPGNVRWATWGVQVANRRSSRFIEWRGEKLHLAGWAQRFGVSAPVLAGRIRRGESLDAVFSKHDHEAQERARYSAAAEARAKAHAIGNRVMLRDASARALAMEGIGGEVIRFEHRTIVVRWDNGQTLPHTGSALRAE